MNGRSFLKTVAAVTLAGVVHAAPSAKPVPVADGFPDWFGITEKNLLVAPRIGVRSIVPSDLRHKVVVVVEADISDMAKFRSEQLPLLPHVLRLQDAVYGSFTMALGDTLVTPKIPRSCVVIVILRGKRDDKSVEAAFVDAQVVGLYNPIYFDAGMVGVPKNETGKYPFCYVLGGRDGKPVWSGVLTQANLAEVAKAVRGNRAALAEWTPLTGVAEPKYHKSAFAKIKSGKTAAAQKDLLSAVRSADPAVAAEAQVMYDAVEQYVSDRMFLVFIERSYSSGLALCELQDLFTTVPPAAKKYGNQLKELKMKPSAPLIAEIIAKIRLWTGENYNPRNPGEAKKALQQIAKYKKSLAALLESDNAALQASAAVLGIRLDAVIPVLESKITK